MPYKSRWSVTIPQCSFPTLLFTSSAKDLTEKPQFIDADDTSIFITRNGFRRWSSRFAQGLLDSGLFKAGDRVMVFSPNAVMFPVVFMGAVMAGGIFTGANPSFTARELAYQWKDSGACVLLCATAALDVGIEAAKIAGKNKDQIFVFDSNILTGRYQAETKGLKHWSRLFASEKEAEGFQWEELRGEGEADRTLALNYSSGTTGFPKGVEITHRNYIANTLQAVNLSQLRPDYAERERRGKWLVYIPLYHAMGQTIFIANAILRGIPVYIMPKFDFEKMLQNVEKFKITELSCVPPIAVALAKSPLVKKYDMSSVEAIGGGAAPMGREIAAQVEKIWGGKVNYKQGYGMTEVTCAVLGWDPLKFSGSFSVGEPSANVTLKVMKVESQEDGSETFTEVTERGPEHRGELWAAGPNIMKGYWRNPEATKNTFAPASESTDGERWLRTGDIVYVDEEGMFYVVDRIKELIKVKGNQVAPAELEALLLEHDAIQDAAVIGVPRDGDEVPRAYVVLQPGNQGEINEDDIAKWVEGKVIRYKRLAGGVEFMEAIPKNPSGKILRKMLREEYKKKEQSTRAKL